MVAGSPGSTSSDLRAFSIAARRLPAFAYASARLSRAAPEFGDYYLPHVSPDSSHTRFPDRGAARCARVSPPFSSSPR